MDEGTPHVAPEIIAVTILIEESQSAPNHCIHHCHTCLGHVVLIHHLNPHALPERVLHALHHLATTNRRGEINHSAPNNSENSFPHRHAPWHCPKLTRKGCMGVGSSGGQVAGSRRHDSVVGHTLPESPLSCGLIRAAPPQTSSHAQPPPCVNAPSVNFCSPETE